MARAGRDTAFKPEIDAFENGKALGLFSIRLQASGNQSSNKVSELLAIGIGATKATKKPIKAYSSLLRP